MRPPVAFSLAFDVETGEVHLDCMGRALVRAPSEILLNHPDDFGRLIATAMRSEIRRQGFVSPYRDGGTL